ncbi:MAG: hypothetical protein WAL92_07355 [Thiogranum sp.]
MPGRHCRRWRILSRPYALAQVVGGYSVYATGGWQYSSTGSKHYSSW